MNLLRSTAILKTAAQLVALELEYRTCTALIGQLAYCWLNVQLARIFGTQKPVALDFCISFWGWSQLHL